MFDNIYSHEFMILFSKFDDISQVKILHTTLYKKIKISYTINLNYSS